MKYISITHLQRASAQVCTRYGVPEPCLVNGSHEAYAVEDRSQMIGSEPVARVVMQAPTAA